MKTRLIPDDRPCPGCRRRGLPSRRQVLGSPGGGDCDLAIISKQPDKYHGWPTVARRKGAVVRPCPARSPRPPRPRGIDQFGRGVPPVEARVLMDTPIDDRDSRLKTVKGSILVTTFTSLAYADSAGRKIAAGEKRLARGKWTAGCRAQSTDERAQGPTGGLMLRSTDAGKTFGEPYRSLVNSPHGPIQLADGRFLYAGKTFWENVPWVGVCESTDDGQNWRRLGGICRRRDLWKLPRAVRRRNDRRADRCPDQES